MYCNVIIFGQLLFKLLTAKPLTYCCRWYIWLKLCILYSRGAVECVHVLGSDKPRETLSTKVVQALLAAYETLRECASVFTELGYREHAAEAHKECAYFLRSVTPELNQGLITNVKFLMMVKKLQKDQSSVWWFVLVTNNKHVDFRKQGITSDFNFTFKLLFNPCTMHRYVILDNIPEFLFAINGFQ